MRTDTALSVALLAMFLWEVGYRLPKAHRDGDRFGVVFSLLTCLVAPWFVIAIAARTS
jgi:hypothetical protein